MYNEATMPPDPKRKKYVAQKAVLVNEQGKVLVLQSTDRDGTGSFWDFPGGQMEPNEKPLETLEREVEEEIGVKIDVSQAVPFHVLVTSGFGDMSGDEIVKTFYTVPNPGEELALSWEHSDARWIDPRQEIPEEIQGFAREVLEKYKQHAKLFGADERILGRKGYGLVQLIHGHGKGKTTAALGQAIRCAGSGRNVAMIYFDKGGSDHYNERAMLDKMENIDYWATGRDRIDAETGRFDFSITQEDMDEAARGLELAREALTSGEYQLVVLDEINSTTDLGMLDVKAVLDLIDNKGEDVELILTGRNPHPDFLAAAHLVTEMNLERHYFYSGVPAREGLDY